jgi:NADH:ubiquinone oxidoreductase subunit 6 (subunit J)
MQCNFHHTGHDIKISLAFSHCYLKTGGRNGRRWNKTGNGKTGTDGDFFVTVDPRNWKWLKEEEDLKTIMSYVYINSIISGKCQISFQREEQHTVWYDFLSTHFMYERKWIALSMLLLLEEVIFHVLTCAHTVLCSSPVLMLTGAHTVLCSSPVLMLTCVHTVLCTSPVLMQTCDHTVLCTSPVLMLTGAHTVLCTSPVLMLHVRSKPRAKVFTSSSSLPTVCMSGLLLLLQHHTTVTLTAVATEFEEHCGINNNKQNKTSVSWTKLVNKFHMVWRINVHFTSTFPTPQQSIILLIKNIPQSEMTTSANLVKLPQHPVDN